MNSKQRLGQGNLGTYIKLILTALCWGGTWIAGRVAVQEASPFMIASWRFLLAALVLGCLLIPKSGWPKWSLRQWISMAALGMFGIFFYNIFFLYGLQRVEAGRGALVVALTPVCIALVDGLVYKTRPGLMKTMGIIVALMGSLLVVTNGHPTRLFSGEVGTGECLLIGSTLSWVVYTFVVRSCQGKYTALEMTFGGCVAGWAMLTILALFDGSLFAFGTLSLHGFSSILFLGLFGSALAFTWYSSGISKIGTTTTAAFINLVPVFAVILGMLLLGERLSPASMIGGGFVILGVILTNRGKR